MNETIVNDIRIFKENGKLSNKYMNIKLDVFENLKNFQLFEPA
jgi:hypothetical protein